MELGWGSGDWGGVVMVCGHSVGDGRRTMGDGGGAFSNSKWHEWMVVVCIPIGNAWLVAAGGQWWVRN